MRRSTRACVRQVSSVRPFRPVSGSAWVTKFGANLERIRTGEIERRSGEIDRISSDWVEFGRGSTDLGSTGPVTGGLDQIWWDLKPPN